MNTTDTQFDRLAELTQEAVDALQARIDAGVRVWGGYYFDGLCFAGEAARDETDTHTAILIDPQPIADHVDDDRKGKADRREVYAKGSCHRVNQTDDTRGKYRTAAPNTRRTTPGTKADRQQPAWRRADGSTTPRTGERRKFVAHVFLDVLRGKRRTYVKQDGSCENDTRDPNGANERRKA